MKKKKEKKDETLDWKKMTPERLMKMAKNLRAKKGGYTAIHYNVWAHSDGTGRAEFWLGGSNIGGDYHSWENLLSRYRRLMYGS